MECPYLSVAPIEKICRLMEEQGLDGELDDFDLTHYCNGTPNHCYFYRLCRVQKPATEQLEENKPEKIQVAFYDELSKLKQEETEVSADHDEPHPLNLKLVKKGFRYKVKPKPIDELVAWLRRKV